MLFSVDCPIAQLKYDHQNTNVGVILSKDS